MRKRPVHLINYLKDQGIADVTEFAVIPFQSSATLYEGLSADEAIARINSLSAGGGTSFGPAIQRGLEFFDGAKAGLTNIAYFLSDGQGSGASTALQAVADVRAFGIGSGASISSLNTIDSNNAVILNSASDLAASFTESEIKTADVNKIEVYLNGNLIETITGDQLTDNGATGLSFSGTIDGLNPTAADTLEAKVYFKDTSIPAQSVTFEIGDGTTEAAGTDDFVIKWAYDPLSPNDATLWEEWKGATTGNPNAVQSFALTALTSLRAFTNQNMVQLS